MSTDLINIQTQIDPRNLQANKRYKHSHVLPTQVRQAMKRLERMAQDQLSESSWLPTPTTRYAVRLSVTFPTANSDIDGPVKRTIDAVFRGMRKAVDMVEVNDLRVVDLHVTKSTGEPGLHIIIFEVN